MYAESDLRAYRELARVLDKAAALRGIADLYDRVQEWRKLAYLMPGTVNVTLDESKFGNLVSPEQRRQMVIAMKRYSAWEADIIMFIPLEELEA